LFTITSDHVRVESVPPVSQMTNDDILVSKSPLDHQYASRSRF